LHFQAKLRQRKDFRISTSGLKIQLWNRTAHFDKHENGISTPYFKGRRHYYPSTTTITLLLDEPGWLIAHHKLYTVKEHQLEKTPF
jgi:non-specific serine/threonine protein kinase